MNDPMTTAAIGADPTVPIIHITGLGQAWSNTSVIEGSATDFVRELKPPPGGDVGVHGSIMLAQSLLTAGLIDEFRLVVAGRAR